MALRSLSPGVSHGLTNAIKPSQGITFSPSPGSRFCLLFALHVAGSHIELRSRKDELFLILPI